MFPGFGKSRIVLRKLLSINVIKPIMHIICISIKTQPNLISKVFLFNTILGLNQVLNPNLNFDPHLMGFESIFELHN